MKFLSIIFLSILIYGCDNQGETEISSSDSNIAVKSNVVGGLAVYKTSYYGITFLCFAIGDLPGGGIDCFHVEEPK